MSKLVSNENLLRFGQQFKSNLADVATSGSYVDLTDKPSFSDYVFAADYEEDEEVVAAALNDLNTRLSNPETWTFELMDGTQITKTVFLN